MKNYSQEVRNEAIRLFNLNFNDLSFELLKKAIGEDVIIDFIVKPSEKIILEEWLADQDDEKLKDEFSQARADDKEIENAYSNNDEGFFDWLAEQYQNEIEDWWFEREHYPMWSTIFEASDKMLSDEIMKNIDKLYDLGIGILDETDYTNACLFIASAGYDFYSAHWIPLFIFLGWLNPDEIDKEKETFDNTETQKKELIDWNKFSDILMKLARNKNETIKRHSEGLLKALKL